jgi:hypothetical protein
VGTYGHIGLTLREVGIAFSLALGHVGLVDLSRGQASEVHAKERGIGEYRQQVVFFFLLSVLPGAIPVAN